MRVGDVVNLKSGSPPMCIEEFTDDGNCAKCVWFQQSAEGYYGLPDRAEFPMKTLVKQKKEKQADEEGGDAS